MQDNIRAVAKSDDGTYTVSFNAILWFEQASESEIVDLAGCEWSNDYPADAVASYCAEFNEGLKELFQYLEHIAGLISKKDECGFECAVDRKDALNWIKENKPGLFGKLEESQ